MAHGCKCQEKCIADERKLSGDINAPTQKVFDIERNIDSLGWAACGCATSARKLLFTINSIISNYGHRECWSLSLLPPVGRQTPRNVFFVFCFGYKMIILDALPFINLYQIKNNAILLCLGWKVGGLVWLKSLSAWCMHVLLQCLQTFKFAVKRQQQKLWNRCSLRSTAIIFYSCDHDRLP